MIKVIVVVGPTSVGKTKMGVSLAKKLNGEVISGDSMQVYRGLDIGSAKVTVDEMDGVVHHLIDIRDPKDSYSVKDFQEQARLLIDDITSRGKVPIIVGGTGLYIKACLYDYTFNDSEDCRDEIIKKYADYSNEQLYDYLKTIDLKSANELHPHNRQRVLRAIEIFEQTGERKSDAIAKQEHKCLYDAYFVGLTIDRPLLHERIAKRVDMMRKAGLKDEMVMLYNLGLRREHQSMKGIGYKEWFDYFDGLCVEEDVYEAIKIHSRQYAKRQYTWFKNQFDVHWYNVDLLCFDHSVEEVLNDLKREW